MLMTTPDLHAWITPPRSALALYEQYWLPTTDAPREYLVACGLSTIGTAIGNRIYIPFGGERIYPNLWNVLLGPSSTFRKSTTVKQARRTLARLTEGQNDGLLFPDEFSKEALVARLAERAQGLLTYSEFSGALAAFNRDYMSGIKELLADLYDSPPRYERIVGQKTLVAKDVCISLLAASQTDWLLEKLKETDIRGGFMARMTFWPAFIKRRFIALPPEPDTRIGNELVRHLNQIRGLEGAVMIPSSCRDRYAAWLEQHERELESLPGAGNLGPFWSRLSVTTLKMARDPERGDRGHAPPRRRRAGERHRADGVPESGSRAPVQAGDGVHEGNEGPKEGAGDDRAPAGHLVPRHLPERESVEEGTRTRARHAARRATGAGEGGLLLARR